MPRRTSDVMLEAKLEEAKRLEAEIRRLKNAARDKMRAEDNQRCKILGRLVWARLEREPESALADGVRSLLAAELIRPGERALFLQFGELRAAPARPVNEIAPGDAS
jgi:hypothetical protein